MARFGLIDKVNNSKVPLKGVRIESKLHGFTAEVVATMEYSNDGDSPIEAVYVFPLDEEAAVCGFQATIDGRTIVAEIQEKQEARDTYDDAISSGQSAFLLEESDESSDIFQVSVGNLPPSLSATVKLTFVTTLKVEKEGRIVFVLPTVLNPRYNPSEILPSASEAFPSIASVTSRYSFDFELDVQCASQISEITSPSNRLRVDINPDDNRQATVRLDENYQFKADVQVHVLCAQPHQPRALVENGVTKLLDGQKNEFLAKPAVMINFFPEFDNSTNLERGEFIFVVDRSGSMGGSKMQSARETLLLFLKSLPENCYFNVVGFGNSFQKLFEKSESYNDTSLNRACSLGERMNADLGGTEILAPLREVFSQPLIKGYPRQIFLLTDGEVCNTGEVVELVRSNATKARCFTFGIGEGASTELVKGVARAGGGTAEFVTMQDRLQAKVMKTLKHALQPAIKDVDVTWNLPKTWSVETVPSVCPAVFCGNELVMFGLLSRMDGSSSQIVAIEGTVTLSGSVDNGKRSSIVRHILKFSAVCGNRAETNLLLHRLCAKASIREQSDDTTIIDLSKSANVVSKKTSFVAVDKDSHVPVCGPIERQARPIYGGRMFGVYGNMSLLSMRHQSAYSCQMRGGPPARGGSMAAQSYSRGIPPPAASRFSGYPMMHHVHSNAVQMGEGGGGGGPPPPMMQQVHMRSNAVQMGGGGGGGGGPPPPLGGSIAAPGVPAHYESQPPPPPPPQRHSSKDAGRKIHKSYPDTHLSLISLQTASGAWQLTDKLANICGITLEKLKQTYPSKLTIFNRDSLWATALALVWLNEKCSSKQDEWEIVANKGTRWLKSNLPQDVMTFDDIMYFASQVISMK